ncbi:MAG: NAD(P)H-dependent oxidoreductase [Corynebacterium sp.]|uniref:NAD(P)H-dependent oxidoreductase n=1 Tax=Corynebacterium sp. TaxID=1720 RepID=UPI0026DC634E|nr:NAD(P)H-dependent oxidoreductase [Corynebacterium sp.]MDO4760327.1 NAD(P)H-dependent oxidoreductase [Corynebacterium sp.]
MATLTVISAGLSESSTSTRLGLSIADAVIKQAQSHFSHSLPQAEPQGNSLNFPSMVLGSQSCTVEVIELKDLALELAVAMTQLYSPTPPDTPLLDKAFALVEKSDALIAVTPVFQASYTGLFKMFFDVLNCDLIKGKPLIIAANAGSQRHALVLEYSLRPLFSFLKAKVVPTSILFTPSDRDPGSPEAQAKFESRIARAAEELISLLPNHTTPSAST